MMQSHLFQRAAHGGAGMLAPLARCSRRAPPPDLWSDWLCHREYYPHRCHAPAWVPFSALDFTGRYVVCLITLAVPKDTLFTIVSSYGMTLVDTDPARHPVIVAAGYQEDVRQILWPGVGALNYMESIIAIPSVRLLNESADATGPFILPTRLDVSELFPILLGRLVGYPKQPASIRVTKDSYAVAPPFGGRPVLEATFGGYGATTTPRELPHFQQTLQWMSRPLVSRTLLEPSVFTYLAWDWENACIQPLEVSLEAGAGLPGLPAGRYQIPGYDCSVFGAARLILPWETAGPFPKSVIRPDAEAQREPADLPDTKRYGGRGSPGRTGSLNTL